MKINIKNISYKIFFINLLLSLIFVNSLPNVLSLSLIKMLILFSLISILLVGIPFIVHKNENIGKVFEKYFDTLHQMRINSVNKQIFKWYAFEFIIEIFALSLIYFLTSTNIYLVFMITSIIRSIYHLIILKKYRKLRIENIFTVFALMCGTTMIACMPMRTGYAWDDQIHYMRASSIVDMFDGRTYVAEQEVTSTTTIPVSDYTRSMAKEYIEKTSFSYKNCEMIPYSSDRGLFSVAYIPFACGMILARGLKLPFFISFYMGLLVNLLFYVLLIRKSIEKVEVGKVFIATFGMIPTTLFMASTYSYDPWVISLTVFGFSEFISIIQKKKYITDKNITIIVGSLFLAWLPKAVYFWMFAPLYFLSKDYFKTKNDKKKYLFIISIAAIFLIGSFILPSLIKSTVTSDLRGGSDVNAIEQIHFILSNPIKATKIILNYFYVYTDPANATGYMTNYAWCGFHSNYILLIMLTLVAFLDKNGKQQKNKTMAVFGILGSVFALLSIIGALYITYTPVGNETVNGCQSRYILPVLFVILWSSSIDKVMLSLNRIKMSLFSNGIMALYFMAQVVTFFVFIP